MISKYIFYVRELFETIWLRVISFGVLAIVATVLAQVFSPYLADDIALHIGSDAVSQLLSVLTSSMLAVTTFSLSVAVAAFAAAARSATPRATVLLREDRTTQNVLATFLGAFLFGLVGLIGLNAEYYDESGKVIVFIFTIGVIAVVVVALIRWIGHLMQFGRMDDTLERVEQAASDALTYRLENPYLGGQPLIGELPHYAESINSIKAGYVQHIDMVALQECAENLKAEIFVRRLPGSFVAEGVPLVAATVASIDEKQAEALRSAFTIGTRRMFDEDPRFGLIVLTEIASRALSPAVNDPGTAIDIIGRHVRILSRWYEHVDPDLHFDRVYVPPITVLEAIGDAFRPIARDGISLFEIPLRLQKALTMLRLSEPVVFTSACEQMADEILERAETALLLPVELELIRKAASAT